MEERTTMNRAFRVKYKPKTFSEMVGIDRHLSIISNLVKHKMTRPMLIVGENGTGKSTLAEIILKRMVCENPSSLDPCLKCDSCNTTKLTSMAMAGYSFSGDELNENSLNEVINSFYFVPNLGFHTLVIDDIDHSNYPSQKRLIKLINTHSSALIISTATKISSIDKPLFQRYIKLSMNTYRYSDLYDLVKNIIIQENITSMDDEDIKALITLAKLNPRNIANILETLKMLDLPVSKKALNSPNVRINLGEQFGVN